MGGFKIEQNNLQFEYFSVSNTAKLTLMSPEEDEFGYICYSTQSIWIDPHSEEVSNIIDILLKTKELL